MAGEWDGHTERRDPEWVDVVVKRTLSNLGFDMRDTSSIQKDILHLRKSRELCELIQNKLVVAVLMSVAAATMGAAWVGFTLAIEDSLSAKTTVVYKTEKVE